LPQAPPPTRDCAGAPEPRRERTVLTGALPDQATLHGVLAGIEAPGLELLEVHRLLP
jgi:hypothetical protein